MEEMTPWDEHQKEQELKTLKAIRDAHEEMRASHQIHAAHLKGINETGTAMLQNASLHGHMSMTVWIVAQLIYGVCACIWRGSLWPLVILAIALPIGYYCIKIPSETRWPWSKPVLWPSEQTKPAPPGSTR